VHGTPVEHVTKHEQPVTPGTCGDTGGETGDHGHHQAQGHATPGATVLPAATTATPSGSPQVPTAVDAGMTRPATLVAARPVAGGARTPGGLLLLLGGAALLSLAGLRLRRS
jgi:hypothetical protein